MPDINDKLRFTIVTELQGVAARNDVYFDVADPGTAGDLATIAALLGQEWILVSNAVLSVDLVYIAFILDNLSQNEVRGVVTTQTTGLDNSGAHPQDQVVRYNEYGHNTEPEPLRRGAFNLMGVGHQFSINGRIADNTEFQAIRGFLSGQFIDSPSQFTANPQIRTRDPGSNPATYQFHRIVDCNPSTRLFKLKSRKVSLLGI